MPMIMIDAKIIHERWKCIGCAACEAVAADFWVMMPDGFASIKGSKHTQVKEGKLEELYISEKDIEDNKRAEEVCPVNCIKVIRK